VIDDVKNGYHARWHFCAHFFITSLTHNLKVWLFFTSIRKNTSGTKTFHSQLPMPMEVMLCLQISDHSEF